MSKIDTLNISQTSLVEEWKKRLPEVLNSSDQARVWADEADSNALRVHITTAGHSMYTFDFKVTYVDSREVKVEVIDVEQEQKHIDERHGVVQNLLDDYVRHIHECAQILHQVTHA
ncbi:hypothetical protein [Paenibacillus hexagrammi]|uniref:Uncharacterized protein n=1 Tax=Paenibacillus hexagrammi TaxID=2908839 RepID=A0ABY3SH29_9BACL|nr:hypothetical protein [Paenibacillus sp. YPD9-1]UJF33299.1 hypothetical protein L0M14_27875 [Paenibacillus sp. YPD9-1]